MRWFDKDLKKVFELLEEAQMLLQDISEAQQEKIDNLPESLQDSERAEKMQTRYDAFESAFDSITNAVDELQEIE